MECLKSGYATAVRDESTKLAIMRPRLMQTSIEIRFPRYILNRFFSLVVLKLKSKGKLKCALLQALRLCICRMARRGSISIALLFLDYGTRRGEGSASRPGRSLASGKTRYTLYCTGGWVGPRSGQDRCGKISPPPGFDLRTVQPIASRYTD